MRDLRGITYRQYLCDSVVISRLTFLYGAQNS